MHKWNDNMSEAPKDGTSILVCKRSMKTPWQVYWYEGKRKQGWRASTGLIMFKPEFWMHVECPQ